MTLELSPLVVKEHCFIPHTDFRRGPVFSMAPCLRIAMALNTDSYTKKRKLPETSL